ncbi:MAG TPA: cytochrome D1 domain-containing protein, partial [Agriterribacter sp.]|nr:cytochrome D1 domain-containing protein [Agriterribacter sp.]
MFRVFAVPILLTAFIFSLTECDAQSTPPRALLALSKANHTLAIVDPASLHIIARIPVGEDPHEMVASTDGKTAYVCIYGGGSLHEINIIDLIAQKPLRNIDTRPLFGPHDITFVNGKAWFTAEGSKAVGRYDPASGKLDWCMGTGQDRTHMIYVSGDGKKIYTTNVSSGTVSILVDAPGQSQPGRMPPPGAKPRENWVQTVIPTARGSEGFDVSPDGRELWTASSEDGTISIIDPEAKKLVLKIDAKVSGANRVKFTPGGKLVFISSLQTGDLTIYDAKSRTEIKRLKMGKGAAGILMDPEAARAFVACSADNYVSIVDLKTLEVTGHIDVGGVPDGLAWAIRP